MNYKTVDGLKRYSIPDTLAIKLFAEAEKALANSYPHPNKVACALLTSSGNIYQGIDYRTQIISLTMHAEATALVNAAIHVIKKSLLLRAKTVMHVSSYFGRMG